MYGPTIFTERVMPSGLVGKTLYFGAVVVSAANALPSRPAQARVISESSLCFIKDE